MGWRSPGVLLGMRPLLVVLASAAVTAAFILPVAWPRVTLADGDDTTAQVVPDGTKIGDVIAHGKLVRDPQKKNAWSVRIHAENHGDLRATVALAVDVQKTVSDPRNRAEPMPESMWSDREAVTLEPGQAIDESIAVPARVAKELSYERAHRVGPWYRAPMGGGGNVITTLDVALSDANAKAAEGT